MRHVFHEILARYLDNEQHAFDPSWREFWPDVRPSWHPLVAARASAGPGACTAPRDPS